MLLDIRAARPIRVCFGGTTKLSAEAHKGGESVLDAARVPLVQRHLAGSREIRMGDGIAPETRP
jgi:hypothetical protein